MKQIYVNYFIDWVIFLAMLVLFATGVVLWGWKKGAPPTTGPSARPDATAQARPNAKPVETQNAAKSAGPTAGQPQGLILWGLFRGNSFLGMTKNGGWKSIHCWVSVLVLLPFMLLHLLMHLKWILHVTASFFQPRKTEVAKE